MTFTSFVSHKCVVYIFNRSMTEGQFHPERLLSEDDCDLSGLAVYLLVITFFI